MREESLEYISDIKKLVIPRDFTDGLKVINEMGGSDSRSVHL